MENGVMSQMRHGTGYYVMDKAWKKVFVLHTDIEGIHSPFQNMKKKGNCVLSQTWNETGKWNIGKEQCSVSDNIWKYISHSEGHCVTDKRYMSSLILLWHRNC